MNSSLKVQDEPEVPFLTLTDVNVIFSGPSPVIDQPGSITMGVIFASPPITLPWSLGPEPSISDALGDVGRAFLDYHGQDIIDTIETVPTSVLVGTGAVLAGVGVILVDHGVVDTIPIPSLPPLKKEIYPGLVLRTYIDGGDWDWRSTPWNWDDDALNLKTGIGIDIDYGMTGWPGFNLPILKHMTYSVDLTGDANSVYDPATSQRNTTVAPGLDNKIRFRY